MKMDSATEMILNSTLAPNSTAGAAPIQAAAGYAVEPLGSVVLRWIVAAAIFLVGMVGNCLVCVVVFKNHRMQTAMNMFLVNLAICDMFVCVINIWFTMVYWELKGAWPFGLAWCKIMPTLQIMNIAASTGSLVAMSVERYRAICMPMALPLSRSQAKLAIALAWTIGLFIALPELGAYKITQTAGQFGCSEKWPYEVLSKVYSMFLFVCMYLLPLIFLLPAYIHMIYKLWAVEEVKSSSGVTQGDPQALKRRQKVLMMMAIVVASYAICLMPYHAVFMWIDYGSGLQFDYIIIFLCYTQLLSWVNSCINPIIYWFFSEQFSKEFNKILGCNRLRIKRRMSFTHSSSDQNHSNAPGHTLNTNTQSHKV